MKATWMICSLLALPAGAAVAADSPWNGTWKLDPQRSHLTGQTFTFSRGPGGMLHYEDGSTASYDFALDGKSYKTWANRTTAWTAAGHDTWDTVTRADGTVRSKGRVVLSGDGKTLTMTFTGTRPDGKEFRDRDVFARVTGTDGLIGTWRGTQVSGPSGPQTFVISSPAPGFLHFDIPDMQASAEGRADGTDHPVTGLHDAAGHDDQLEVHHADQARIHDQAEWQARQQRCADDRHRRRLVHGQQLEFRAAPRKGDGRLRQAVDQRTIGGGLRASSPPVPGDRGIRKGTALANARRRCMTGNGLIETAADSRTVDVS